jgi:hypothetical protein
MSTYAEDRSYSKHNADEAFQILVRTLPEMGFAVWKTRPIGWLIIANRETESGKLNLTISLRPGAGAQMNASLACESLSEEDLQTRLGEILNQIDEHLS